jgi:3-deoxy-D-manno-octulosonate 8-phosphate phosphatase (KDO 8-P phosphatase)
MIKLLVFDIDGCMTNGTLIYDANGIESKSFNVKDGLGITTWIKMGGKTVIITGRNSSIVEKRAKELGIQHLFQGINRKKEVLLNLLEELSISTEEIAVIGDDLNDLGMLELAKISFAPADATAIIKEKVDVVLEKKGGEGAIREMIDYVVAQNQQTQKFIDCWL